MKPFPKSFYESITLIGFANGQGQNFTTHNCISSRKMSRCISIHAFEQIGDENVHYSIRNYFLKVEMAEKSAMSGVYWKYYNHT